MHPPQPVKAYAVEEHGGIVDEIDSTSEREAFFERQAIHEIRARVNTWASAKGSEICEDCGDDIPKARRLAQPGCTLCISCQDALERSYDG